PSAAGALTPVWADDAAAVRETVSYLHALGHRRIARVAGLPDLVHTVLRDQAFTAACQERGLDWHTIAHTDYTGEEGAHATRRLMSARTRPTALAHDHVIAAVARKSPAEELRIRVAAELSVVAWHDSTLSQFVRPALSAIARESPAYRAQAARTLLPLIEG